MAQLIQILNRYTVSYDYGVYFLAPSGYRCRVDLADNASDAILQIMNLIFNYPDESQIPQLNITGPKRASVNNAEQYVAEVTSSTPTMGIEWVGAHGVELSCTDCGNPTVRFSNSRYNWIEAVVRNQYSVVRKRVSVEVRNEWEKGFYNSYCMDDSYKGEINSSMGIEEYGMRMERGTSLDNNKLVGVMHYVNTPGDYTLKIYTGGIGHPENLAFSKTYHIEEYSDWMSFKTDTIPIDENAYYWVTFSVTGASRLGAFSQYSGNPNGAFYRVGTTWDKFHDRTWMIKALTIKRDNMVVDFNLKGNEDGVVGRSYTFVADGPEDATYRWFAPQASTQEATGRQIELGWERPGDYTVGCVATIGSRQVTKEMTVNIIECPERLEVPMHESFEDITCQCWTTSDGDGDGSSWMVPETTGDATDGERVAASSSVDGNHVLTPSNWLISPRIHIPNGGAEVSWWDFSPSATAYAENYRVLVSTTGNDIADFDNELVQVELLEGQQWVKHNAGLYEYLGQDIYIAFVHDGSDNGSQLYIDNISLSGADCWNIELPYEERFENGDFTYCWRFVDGDGDRLGWTPSTQFFSGHMGYNSKACAASASWHQEALTPDNWLITPSISLPEETSQLEWWESSPRDDDYAEHYAVLLSTKGNDIADFDYTLYEATVSAPNTWRQRQVSLADFAGQTVYVAFRHFDCTDQFFLLIDNVKLTADNGGDKTDGIDEASQENVCVYPNPTNSKLHIVAEGLRRVELLDMTGRTLLSTSDAVVNMEDYASGVYFVRITAKNSTMMERVTKR
ncbi:MAG: choice-of-anchor J domain-containing protein [Bacteroidales bacterium]|nr:choice-of-anchor J domain-containing protein [Bacteroidales bacterium]